MWRVRVTFIPLSLSYERDGISHEESAFTGI